jgi:signal transduction histidine kinase
MLSYIGHIIEVSTEKAELVVSALRSHLNEGADETATEFLLKPELEAVLALIGITRRPSITVEWIIEDGFMLFGRRRQLFQVWFNVVKNAAQAIDYAGTLQLRAEKTGTGVKVSIEDDGPGIPIAFWDRVFTPFFTTKGDGQGQGLGLDLCKRIVEQHGGSISFESRQGKTVFLIRLPDKAYRYLPV